MMKFLLQGVKVILLAALICAAVAIGFIVWTMSFGRPTERYLKAAESAYTTGATAFNSREADKAEQSFNDAMLQANKALEALDKKAADAGADRKAEDVAADGKQRGQAVYVKVRAQAGLEFTKLLKENKPLPFPADTPEDKQTLDQLSYWRIPNPAVKADIREGLVKAAKVMPDNKELLKEALKNEIAWEPPNWNLVKEFGETLVSAGEPDERALYQLARHEFEQHLATVTKEGANEYKVTPPEKRNRERVLKALDYSNRLAEVEGANRRLRSIALEANIRSWLVQYYSRAERAKPEIVKEQADKLNALLFDETNGALRRAAQDTMLAKLSKMDREGVLELHKLAMERAIEDGKSGAKPGRTSDQVLQVLSATLTYCNRLASSPEATAQQVSDAFDVAVACAVKAQPYLAREHPEAWKAQLAAIDPLKQKATEKKVAGSKSFVLLANLYSNEASYQGSKGQSSAKTQFEAKANQIIKEGIGAAENKTSDQALALHILTVRSKLMSNPARAEIDESLRILQQSQAPAAQATYHLAEGMFAVREGRVTKAIEEFERVLRQGDIDATRKAHSYLGAIQLALGHFDKALASLLELERGLTAKTDLSEEEKAWFKDFIQDQHLLNMTILRCELELGSTEYQHMKRLLKPGARMSQEFSTKLVNLEADADRRIKKLPADSKQLRTARQMFVMFLFNTDQRDRGDRELQAVKQEFPNSAEVLGLEAVVLMRNQDDKERVAKIDKRIQEFVSQHPGDIDGRLLWVWWLSETNRSGQALTYVEDTNNFPGKATDPKVAQARAALQAYAGNRNKLAEFVRGGDAGPGISFAAMQYLDSEDKNTVLNRLQSQPIRTIGQANEALNRKEFKSAIDGYVKTLEFAQVQHMARQGIERALLEMANENPAAAKDEAAKILAQYPNQSGVLFAYAYACILLDEHGDPNKPFTEVNDTASALAMFENVLVQEGTDKSTVALLKANLWVAAGRIEFARLETQRAIDAGPRNEEALKLSIALALQVGDPASLSMAERQVAILRDVAPNSKDDEWMFAQILEKQDRSRDAIIAYEAMVRDDPTLTPVYQRLLPLLERSNMTDRAKTWLAVWRNAVPHDIIGAQADVRMRCLNGQLDDARQVAERFVASNLDAGTKQLPNLRVPPNMDAEKFRQAYMDDLQATGNYMMAGGFRQGKAYAEAEAWVQRSLKFAPGTELFRLELGDIYREMMRETADPARRAQLAQQAKAEYSKVYTEKKGNYDAGNNLAWLLVKELNDPEEAMRIAREVRRGKFSGKPVSGDRLQVEFLDTLGLIYRALNKPELFEEMRLLFEDARRSHPTDPRIYLYLGDAYAGLGQTRMADQMYANAITLAGPRSKSRMPVNELQNILEDANNQKKKLGPRSALK